MNDALWVAILSGPAAVTLDRLVTWLRNRRKEAAEVGLTVDQRWQRWADELKGEVDDLRTRVVKLEEERETLLARVKGLVAEVDHYRRVARSMARHVLRLRDALASSGADVPQMPADVEDALTVIDMP